MVSASTHRIAMLSSIVVIAFHIKNAQCNTEFGGRMKGRNLCNECCCCFFPFQIEDEVMRRVMKETQERVRMFEENQRRWQDQHHLSSPPPLQQATVSILRPKA